MAVPIIKNWKKYFQNPEEGLGSSYERVVINIFLMKLVKHFSIKSVLETPSFGFTGVSGINSMDFAKNGCNVTILDNDKDRVSLIKKVWEDTNLSAEIRFVPDFQKLNFDDNNFDFSWNFSAMWFVKDLPEFLSELTRVTKKVIAIFVPNTNGLGYRFQKYSSDDEFDTIINEENINPERIKAVMSLNGWKLFNEDFIDCPPWPDIGMPKEKFASMFGIKLPEKKGSKEKKPLTILDYFRGEDPDFYSKMLRYSFVEKYALNIFKSVWSHHRWMLFLPEKI